MEEEVSTDEEVEEPVADLATVATSPPVVPQPSPSVKTQPDSSGSLGFTKELSSLLASKMGSLITTLNENTAETVPETKTQDTVIGNRPSVPSKPVVANKPVIGNKPSVAKPTVASKPAEVTDPGRVKGSQRRRPPPPPKAKVWFINYFYEMLLLVFHTV